MNLNLGLESLNGANTVVYRNTENNSNLFNACDSVVGELVASIENLFDAAKNAVAIRKALKQYGKTQSIVALVGQEGLATAQSFSMEGFWQSAKNLLIKIWNKICEWWNRFWSIFFSNEKKMQELASTTGTLARPVEYEGAKIDDMLNELKKIEPGVKIISEKVTSVTLNAGSMYSGQDSKNKWHTGVSGSEFTVSNNEANNNGASRGGQIAIEYIVVKLNNISDVKKRARDLAAILKKCAAMQKKIDETSKKALDSAKKIKSTDDSQATIDNSKLAAKIMRNVVQQFYKVANTEAAKLSAHTNITK